MNYSLSNDQHPQFLLSLFFIILTVIFFFSFIFLCVFVCVSYIACIVLLLWKSPIMYSKLVLCMEVKILLYLFYNFYDILDHIYSYFLLVINILHSVQAIFKCCKIQDCTFLRIKKKMFLRQNMRIIK